MHVHRLSHCSIIALTAVTVLGADPVSAQSPPEPAEVSRVMTKALEDRQELPPAEGSLWRFLGPRTLDGSLAAGLVPDSGRINEVAIHPTDPQIMYATGATGGVWKTTDGGSQWAAQGGADWRIQGATAVAIDPANPNRVFVGTGDYKRLDHVEPFSVGIMRSLDGGRTWNEFGAAELGEYTVSRIVIDPHNSNTVLAAAGRGSRLPSGRIFRSTDGGATWQASADTPDANWDDLELCSNGIFWASATRKKNLDVANNPGNQSGLVYQSLDRGVTWQNVNVTTDSFDWGSAKPDTVHVACSPNSGMVLIAVYLGGGARVFKTVDSGLGWTELTVNPVNTASNPWAHSAFGITGTHIYLGGVNMFRGPLDGNTTAIEFSQIPGPVHSDFQCVVPDPTEPDVVFLCTDGGMYRHSAQSNTTTSDPFNVTLGVTQAFRMDVHRRHGGLVALGTQDLGTLVSFAGNGNSPADLRKPPVWALQQGGDGRSAAFRQDSTSRVYLANTDGRVVRYEGSTPTQLQGTDAPNSQAPLLFQNDTLYYADKRFWRLLSPETKTEATADWIPSEFRPGGPLPADIQSLAVCSTNDQAMYAASQTGEIFFSEDGGLGWREINASGANGVPALPIWAISPSPTDCRDVLIGVGYDGPQVIRNGSNTFHEGDRLFHNADATSGGPWTGVHGGPQALPRAPVYAIVRHPAAPDSTWFVAGDVGVFRTDDHGDRWANASASLGLPNTLVRDLRLSADGNTLYAGTFGRGVWSMDVARPASDLFGVRGAVTVEGRPLGGATVVVFGPGRIRNFLTNTLTSGSSVATAPIAVGESATISGATASLSVINAESVSLVTPTGTPLPMSTTTPNILGIPRTYSLTAASAAALSGQQTRGGWTFAVTGASLGLIRLAPSLVSGHVDFDFTDRVSNTTTPDGGYTIEYVRAGSRVVSILDCDCPPVSLDLTAHRTNVDIEVSAVSIVASVPTASESGATGRFTVSRNPITASPLTVNYSIGGTAASGIDYSGLSGSVTIPADSASASITITPVNDTSDEDSETVILGLVPGNYEVDQLSQATVQILDNDPLPVLRINNVTVSEGGKAVLTLTLSPASGRAVTLGFTTADGTARSGLCGSAGGDYLSQRGTRTFAPGTTTQPVIVATCADAIAERSETFVVDMMDPVNASFPSGQNRGTGTIVDSSGSTGTFLLSPTNAAVAVHERLTYALTWTVPEPRTWRDLKTLDLRIRHGKDLALWVRFDEAANTFALFLEASGKFGRGVAPGSPQVLQTREATLHMADTSAVGSGPTGPSVTLNLSLSFRPQASGRTYAVEVAATDDLRNRDAFAQAGRLTVSHQRKRHWTQP